MFWEDMSVPFSRVKQTRSIGCTETSLRNFQFTLHNIIKGEDLNKDGVNVFIEMNHLFSETSYLKIIL
jgi:hypothetical protein